jgi:hypothetical protein
MNKYKLAVSLLFIAGISNAALISRTYSYTDGNTMSANENNTNESTLYNEINGNLNNANILDGGIATADLADSAVTTVKIADLNVTAGKLAAAISWIQYLANYRRPVLKFISVTTVDVEANTSTSNQTCILFPDERRCVTENTASTSVNRRFIITETASFSGTKNSGMAPGETEANNVWYAVYAVKTTDVTTDFVLAASTNTPVQASASRLDTLFGANSWVYLGMIRNGNKDSAPADIVSFVQVGAVTRFNGNAAAVNTVSGIVLSSATATSNSYTYTSGFSDQQIPSHLGIVIYGCNANGAASNSSSCTDSTASRTYMKSDNANATYVTYFTGVASEGVRVANSAGAAVVMGTFLGGFFDGVLGVGSNPGL